MKRLLRKASFGLAPVACALIVAMLMKTVFLLGFVPTASMEPTIPAKSWILGWRLYGDLNKDDVVIFAYGGKTLVKRIAALSNETVIKNGIEFRVPNNHYYLLGDNENCSYDSRFWDDPFVSEDSIIAKLIFFEEAVYTK